MGQHDMFIIELDPKHRPSKDGEYLTFKCYVFFHDDSANLPIPLGWVDRGLKDDFDSIAGDKIKSLLFGYLFSTSLLVE